MNFSTLIGTTGLVLRRISASSCPDPIIKVSQYISVLVDVSLCTGCKACEEACIQWNDLTPPIAEVKELTADGSFGYEAHPDLRPDLFMQMRFREYDGEKGFIWFITKYQCMHCSDPGCLIACPSPGAIVQYANGIVDYDREKCIGCKMCSIGCPFNIPRYNSRRRPFKCNFCLDRVSNGLEPACVKVCPTRCLSFGVKEDMVQKGKKIAERLKANGFDKAALYNPRGVGGTGYIYVLPHGDKTEMYGQLPQVPSSPNLDELLKIRHYPNLRRYLQTRRPQCL